VLDEQPNPPLTVLEVREHGLREQLLPQRLPEPLDLAAGLRVVRTALDVNDAVALELRFELGRSTPRRVLAALVGQDLARRAVLADRARQRFEHEHAPLVMRHHEAHEVARVIVQERRDVNPLVTPKQEREQVRLPQLVRLGPLEVLHYVFAAHALRGRLRLHALTSQHSAHCRLRHSQAQEAAHHVADPSTPRARLRRLRREDRLRTGARTRSRTRLGLLVLARESPARLERRSASLAIRVHPLDRRRVRHAQFRCYRIGCVAFFNHQPHYFTAQLDRPRPSAHTSRTVGLVRLVCLALGVHLSAPSLITDQQIRATSAR
jgi:hypothetical protein